MVDGQDLFDDQARQAIAEPDLQEALLVGIGLHAVEVFAE